jgi:isoleucyl-tRNA synthetase
MQRFQKWLENVNDWCFSRNRYWGNPIPLWTSDDFEEIVCISSVDELVELAGLPKDTKFEDLHMHNIDHI